MEEEDCTVLKGKRMLVCKYYFSCSDMLSQLDMTEL